MQFSEKVYKGNLSHLNFLKLEIRTIVCKPSSMSCFEPTHFRPNLTWPQNFETGRTWWLAHLLSSCELVNQSQYRQCIDLMSSLFIHLISVWVLFAFIGPTWPAFCSEPCLRRWLAIFQQQRLVRLLGKWHGPVWMGVEGKAKLNPLKKWLHTHDQFGSCKILTPCLRLRRSFLGDFVSLWLIFLCLQTSRQSQKKLVGALALPTGKFLRVYRKWAQNQVKT